nr:MAG TPA: hypothetical protein [Caudoviricetes sp.]
MSSSPSHPSRPIPAASLLVLSNNQFLIAFPLSPSYTILTGSRQSRVHPKRSFSNG